MPTYRSVGAASPVRLEFIFWHWEHVGVALQLRCNSLC